MFTFFSHIAGRPLRPNRNCRQRHEVQASPRSQRMFQTVTQMDGDEEMARRLQVMQMCCDNILVIHMIFLSYMLYPCHAIFLSDVISLSYMWYSWHCDILVRHHVISLLCDIPVMWYPCCTCYILVVHVISLSDMISVTQNIFAMHVIMLKLSSLSYVYVGYFKIKVFYFYNLQILIFRSI